MGTTSSIFQRTVLLLAPLLVLFPRVGWATTLAGGGVTLDIGGSGPTAGTVTSLQVGNASLFDSGATSGFWVKNAPATGSGAWTFMPGGVDGTGAFTASGPSLSLTAQIQQSNQAIRFDGVIRDTSGASSVSRGIVLRFALPVGSSTAPVVVGLDPDLSPVSDGGVVQLVQVARWDLVQQANLLPLTTATVPEQGSITLGVPFDSTAVYRTGYSKANGLYVDFDLGLSSQAASGPQASFSFVIYRNDPEWTFRDALAQYYALFASEFTGVGPSVGAWFFSLNSSFFDGGLTPETFDLRFDEHAGGRWPYDSQHGIIGMEYSLPWEFYETWSNADGGQCHYGDSVCGSYRTCDGGPCPCDAGSLCACASTPPRYCGLSQDAAAAQRALDLAASPDSGRPEIVRIIENAGMREADGGYQYDTSYFGYQGDWVITYHTDPDPNLPSPNLWDWEQSHGYFHTLALLDMQDAGQLIGGWYLDNVGSYVSARTGDFNSDHFSTPGVSLTYDYGTGAPVLLGHIAEDLFVAPFREQLHSAGRMLFGNGVAYAAAGGAYLHPRLYDAMGLEGDVETHIHPYDCPTIVPLPSCPDFELRLKRALMFHKPVATLDYEFISPSTPLQGAFIADGGTQSVEYRLRHLLVYGIEPGFNPYDATNPAQTPGRLQALAPLYEKYSPLYRALADAGWEPLTYAKLTQSGQSVADAWVERFGDPASGQFYLVIRNAGSTSVDATLTLELDRLGIGGPVQVSDAMDGTGFSAILTSTSPSLSLSVADHDTMLLALTVPHPGSAMGTSANLSASSRCGCGATGSESGLFLLLAVLSVLYVGQWRRTPPRA